MIDDGNLEARVAATAKLAKLLDQALGMADAMALHDVGIGIDQALLALSDPSHEADCEMLERAARAAACATSDASGSAAGT